MGEATFTAKITSKRQITLPKGLCDRLGLREGDRVAFVEDDEGIHVKRDFDPEAFRANLRWWREQLKPHWKEQGYEGMTADEIFLEIRGPDPVDEIEQAAGDP